MAHGQDDRERCRDDERLAILAFHFSLGTIQTTRRLFDLAFQCLVEPKHPANCHSRICVVQEASGALFLHQEGTPLIDRIQPIEQALKQATSIRRDHRKSALWVHPD